MAALSEGASDSPLAALARELGLDEAALGERLAYVGFGADDAELLGSIALPAVADDEFFAEFYGQLQKFAVPAAVLQGSATLERLKKTLLAYFERLFSGRYDFDYLLDRLRVGVTYHRVGLEPAWYFGAYATFLCGLLRRIEPVCRDQPGRFLAVTQALLRLVFFDIGVALDAYHHEDKKALQAAIQQRHITFNAAPVGLAVLDGQLRVARANPAFVRLLGVSAEQVAGQSLQALFGAALADDVSAALGGDAPSGPWRVAVERAGEAVTVSLSCSALPGTGGALLVAEDVSQHERLQAALQESEDTLLRAQAVAGIGSWRLDIDRDEVRWTPQAYRIYGLPEGTPINFEAFLACVHPADRDRVMQAWQAALAGADYHIEHRVLGGGGERWVLAQAEIYRDRQGRPRLAVGTVQDITERKGAAQRIEQLAFYDALTGLPNRVSFMQRLGQAIEAADADGQRLALLYLDLDRFKELNDAEGHGAGDRVLVEVARRLLATVGGQGTVARLSGDEFGLLVPERDEASTRRMIAAVHGSLAMKTRHHAHAVPASMGIAFYPDDAADAQELLIHAEIAMYQAKARGATHYFYKKQLGDTQRRRYALARALEHALASDQLTLHYQPQVSAHDGRLTGVEALARWRDPQRGWISPAEFIPVAESYGLVSQVGRMALRQAAAQVAAWRAAGTPLPGRVAVNVSARQLEDADFYDDALAIVRHAGATPADIELELTETALMRDPNRAVELTQALVAAGFSIAVDDFGTGYSSLVQLKRLPVGKLKIDMSLVRDMLTDRSDHAIVEAIVAMGRSLGVATVAEGAESAEQVAELRRLGCGYIQGYYFGRPMAASQLHAEWLSRCARGAAREEPAPR